MKEPRSKKLSPVGKWLWEQRFSDRDFANKMKAELGVPKFSASTVENWRYGTRNPHGKNLNAIIRLTGLTAGQILGMEAP